MKSSNVQNLNDLHKQSQAEDIYKMIRSNFVDTLPGSKEILHSELNKDRNGKEEQPS